MLLGSGTSCTTTISRFKCSTSYSSSKTHTQKCLEFALRMFRISGMCLCGTLPWPVCAFETTNAFCGNTGHIHRSMPMGRRESSIRKAHSMFWMQTACSGLIRGLTWQKWLSAANKRETESGVLIRIPFTKISWNLHLDVLLIL